MPGPYTTFVYGDPAAVTGFPSNPYYDGPLNFVCGLYITGSGGGGAAIPIMWGEQLDCGAIGAAYSETITASGGVPPYTFSLASGSLPTGLALSLSGVISGTPSAAGTFTFAVECTDSAVIPNSNTQTFQIIVSAASAGNFSWSA